MIIYILKWFLIFIVITHSSIQASKLFHLFIKNFSCNYILSLTLKHCSFCSLQNDLNKTEQSLLLLNLTWTSDKSVSNIYAIQTSKLDNKIKRDVLCDTIFKIIAMQKSGSHPPINLKDVLSFMTNKLFQCCNYLRNLCQVWCYGPEILFCQRFGT